MKKKIFSVCFALCVLCCLCLPVYADDTTTETTQTETATAETAIGDDLASSAEEHTNAFMDLLDSIQQSVDDALGGYADITAFYGAAIGGIIAEMPAFAVYLILFCVCLSVIAVVRALKDP